MIGFGKKLSRASVLVGACAAVMAVGGAGASTASAATCGSLTGEGSTLQNEAQKGVWGPGWETTCPGSTLSYLGGGSGAGLKAWRLTTAKEEINHARQFIGTDDGPTAAQILAGRESAELTGKGATHVVVVPVAQTAIAIAVHPPASCTITKITNANLVKAFNGQAHIWSEIGATGTGCSGTLTRVVRKEGSGTSFQFKNYLSKVESALPCTVSYTNAAGGTSSATTWVGLQEIEAKNTAEAPNTVWPTCSSPAGAMAPIQAAGGGAVAETVVSTEGTIGYAALPDAKAKKATVIEVQNSPLGTSAGPGTAEEESGKKGNANCQLGSTRYTVPAEGQTTGTGLDVEWTSVFGGNPAIGTGYPICTLTYDLGWTSYEQAGFAAGVGAVAKSYFESEIASDEATLTTAKKWYAALPETTGTPSHDVQGAAVYAVSKVN
jgi:ABC-type phosphate transport system substrate-binding protein